MRLAISIDYRRDIIPLVYVRKVIGEYYVSFRLPFTRQGIKPGRKK